jgi:small subunit ribosomal protein S17
MAEEEKQDTEETTEETADEQAPEAETPSAEDTQAEADPDAPGREAEEASGSDSPEGQEETAAEAEAEAEAAEGVLSPKALRKRERSRASGPARPQRGAEERASERAEARRGASVRRRRYRASRRAKRGEPGQGTPRPDREPGSKKVRQGTVVSAAADKTITVEIPVVRRHPTYEKVVRRTSKLHAHDEANTAQEGDVVRVIESRPLSRTKRWRLLDVVERSR